MNALVPGERRACFTMAFVSGDRGPTVDYVEDESTELGTPFLEVVRGADAGPPVALAPGSAVIGRDDSADLVSVGFTYTFL